MRRYYVGITRAKNHLSIHTDGTFFDNLKADKHAEDSRQYSMPEEVVLQLSHRDVNLGYFKYVKRDVLALRSGDVLRYEDGALYGTVSEKPVARLSQSMLGTIAEWQEKGYKVRSASVRFIVAWKPKEAPKEEPASAVLLADMVLALG